MARSARCHFMISINRLLCVLPLATTVACLVCRAEDAAKTNHFGFSGPEIFPIDNQISLLHVAEQECAQGGLQAFACGCDPCKHGVDHLNLILDGCGGCGNFLALLLRHEEAEFWPVFLQLVLAHEGVVAGVFEHMSGGGKIGFVTQKSLHDFR